MTDNEIHTIRDLIYYRYSIIVAKNALNLPDREDAKARHYGFIKSIFRGYMYGHKTWSEITGEVNEPEKKDNESDNDKCAYCSGSVIGLHSENILPLSFITKPGCSKCKRILTQNNQVIICPQCSSSKSSYGLFEYYKKINPDIFYYYDFVPRELERIYLKSIYYCHECAGTLGKTDLDGDGKLTVLDIDFILH